MVLIIHHLGLSQSERIVWLLEELGLEYTLVKHVRDPLAAPASLRGLPGNTLGKAPFFEDTDAGVRLAESGAIAAYLLTRWGQSLCPRPDDHVKFLADYLHWFHWCSGTFHPALQTKMFLTAADVPADKMIRTFTDHLAATTLTQLDARLAECQWVARERFTAADIMINYNVTTNRYFGLTDLTEYPHILRWMRDCSQRPAYQRAREKADPDMRDLLDARPPKVSLIAAGGVENDVWRKEKQT